MLTLAAVLSAGSAADIDAAFKAFWDARSPQEASNTVPKITASGVSFADAPIKTFWSQRDVD